MDVDQVAGAAGQVVERPPDGFRRVVDEYCEIHDRMTAMSKQLAALRKDRVRVEGIILDFMKTQEWDKCMLPDGGELERRETRRVGSVNKQRIMEALKASFGNDEERAQACIQRIYENRPVVTSEVLARRSPAQA